MRLTSSALFLALLLTPGLAFAQGKAPDCKNTQGKPNPACSTAQPAQKKQPTAQQAKPSHQAAPAAKADKMKKDTKSPAPKPPAERQAAQS